MNSCSIVFKAGLFFLVVYIFGGKNCVHSHNLLEDENLFNDERLVKHLKELKQVVQIIEKVQIKNNNSTTLSSKESFDSYVIQNSNELSNSLWSDARVDDDNSDFNKILPLTQYCGPGNWVNILSGGAINNRYGDSIDALDHCCELHDKCNVVLGKETDIEKYPGLSWSYSFFTRWSI
jgi:hypothetical protein